LKADNSVKNNPDREKINKYLELSQRNFLTPKKIIELYDMLGDTRLVAFVAGTPEDVVVQAIEGETFPSGMTFSVKYVAEVIGVSDSTVFNIMKEAGLPRLIDRDSAIEIYKYAVRHDLRGYRRVVEAMSEMGAGRRAFGRIAKWLDLPTTIYTYSLCRREILDAVCKWEHNGVKAVCEYSNLNKSQLKLGMETPEGVISVLPKEWRSIVDEVMSMDCNRTQKHNFISDRIQKRHVEIFKEVKRAIRKYA
jgi:hypothetical protein